MAGDDGRHFSEVCDALDVVGFEAGLQEDIFTCLSALLHLGNVQFFDDINDYSHILDSRSGPVHKVSVRACEQLASWLGRGMIWKHFA